MVGRNQESGASEVALRTAVALGTAAVVFTIALLSLHRYRLIVGMVLGVFLAVCNGKRRETGNGRERKS